MQPKKDAFISINLKNTLFIILKLYKIITNAKI